MKNSILQRGLKRTCRMSIVVPLLGLTLTGCEDDLLTGTPSWLGESVMGELERRGNFSQTIKLIQSQDEDYESVLRKTGSKTVFVADDAAWNVFYNNNPWGVRSIDDLTAAQKKLLFKSNMIDSPYLIEQLGNIPAASATSDPVEGSCMRRSSSVGIMDSVPLVSAASFPVINPIRVDSKTGEQVDHWKRLRGKENAYILQDNSVAPIIHFMPKFMQVNNITADDVSFLTNGEINTTDSAFINGKVVKETDVTCQNGYIHVLNGVAVPLDNLANVIANNPNFSIYKRLLDRFSYPSYDETQTAEFHRQYGGEDSIFVKKYFNSHTQNGFNQYDANDGGTTILTLLPFDPGHNRYIQPSASGMTFQQDAGVMLVPTDEAMIKYLETEGSDLNERYANAGPGATAWDNAPDEVILPLLRNTMLVSLRASIPSMFGSVNNTAGEPMGVTKSDIDSVLWACNGVIYQTNKVYVAPEYLSVFYPAVIRAQDDLRMVYTVVNNDNLVTGSKGLYAYLNNMTTTYSFIIPTDNALQACYDPVSYKRTDNRNRSTAAAYQFYINENGRIAANAFLVDWNTLDEKGRGQITSDLYSTAPTAENNNSAGDAFNYFYDIINSSMAVELFTPGQKFYTARNGSPIVVEWAGDNVTGVAGSFQYERGYYIPVTERFDKSEEGNGRSYLIDDEPLLNTTVSPAAAIADSNRVEYFGEFAKVMAAADIWKTDKDHATMDRAIGSLNNYHYTIYVPTNASVRSLIDAHQLPTAEDIDAITAVLDGSEADSLDQEYLTEQKAEMQRVIDDFVNCHIQDNALYVDGKEISGMLLETACLDTLTNRFVKLNVSYQRGGEMKVMDNCGNVRTVSRDMNNILTRQYYFNAASLKGTGCTQIYSSSFAVIHQIDAPLFPGANSLYDPEEYDKVMEKVNKYQDSSSVRRYRK